MGDHNLPNKQVCLREYPEGGIKEEHFEVTTSSTSKILKEGSQDVLLKNIFLSLDPYMRNLMDDPKKKNSLASYIGPFELHKVLKAAGVSAVVASAHPEYQEGDIVQGYVGWEEYTLVEGGKGLRKLPPGVAPASYYLGVLGMPGMTAYFGLLDICAPKAGERVFVSAAAGAVGQLVGQLAKLSGCYVVGSAGSAQKVELLKTYFGFDDAFNYKEEPDFNAALKRYFPEGIDIYFENVGGKQLEAVLGNMRTDGRVSVCGMVSQYNRAGDPEPVHNLFELVARQIKMQGFLVSRYLDRMPQFLTNMGAYMADKKIKYLEDVTNGIENAPAAFVGMLHGLNVGKAVVRIAPPFS